MEEANGMVKHVLLAKFKGEIPPEKIEELIKSYAALVPKIDPMKSFHWGKDVSIENLHQGFTHVFESDIREHGRRSRVHKPPCPCRVCEYPHPGTGKGRCY